MTLSAYQFLAMRTAPADRTVADQLTNAALGLTGEAGEVADHIKKVVFHAHELDRDAIIKELGDVLWYVAAAATALDVDLGVVAARNVAKLRARYPDGFDAARSRARVDVAASVGAAHGAG
jgi:NTP pyrophosphatase (non-canonical NTP hydrolase)